MKNKILSILSLLTRFIFACLFTAFIALLIIKINFLDPDFVLKKLDDINYYEKLSKSISSEMNINIVPAGLDKEVLEGLTDKNYIKKEVTEAIYSFYKNKPIYINEKEFENKLNSNIDTFFEKHNITVTNRNALDKFIDQMKKIYKNEVLFFGALNKIEKPFNKIIKLIDVLLLALIAIITILYLIIKFAFKDKIIATSAFTAAGIYLIGILYLKESIDIKNITLFGSVIAELLKTLIYTFIDIFKITSFILIIFGLLLIIFDYFYAKLLKKKIN